MTTGDKMKNQSGKHTKAAREKYPRICCRIDGALLSRVDEIKDKSGLSYGQMVSQAFRRYLPELEKFHAAK